MSIRRVIKTRAAARAGLIAWVLTSMLVVTVGAEPSAAEASPLQLRGALQRTGDISEGGVGIVSHRGAAALAPENTLTAFQIAIDQGVDFVEADVRVTADGIPVLMHDLDVDRTTNGSGLLESLTLEQVKALDAGSWFDTQFAGEPVPTLNDFVDLLVPAPTRAFIELKGEWTPEQISAVVELMRANGLWNRVVFESFEVPNLEMLRLQAPEFATMLLTRELGDATLDMAIDLRVSAIGARKQLFLEDPAFVAHVREAGIGAMVYTLNTADQWERAVELGIDFIITDDPEALAEWRSQQHD